METESQELLLDKDEPPGSEPSYDDWRQELRNSITSPEELVGIFDLPAGKLRDIRRVAADYPFSITPYYLSLIDLNNPDDPVRKQCVPAEEELTIYYSSQDDPLDEEKDSPVPGLVHRYPDRVLVTLTNMCPVYCRHCTRKREWRRGKWMRSRDELEAIYDYIRISAGVKDVILSGGDPLMLSNERLDEILKRIRNIPHVEIIRIGTRCPVVLPKRIDDGLTDVLRRYRPIWVNTHFNHPNEITEESKKACDRLVSAGIPVNNQSVLLKGINDNLDTMIRLCRRLLTIGVRPYYLFQCDPVNGTGHLRTSVDKGVEIVKGMRGFISGLAVPTFVVDGLEGQGKVPLQANYLAGREDGHLLLKSYKGEVFRYYNPDGEP